MPKFVRVNKDLILVGQDVKSKKVVEKKQPANHIWIYDRSGSMYYDLPELIEQLVVLSKGLPKGDTLTIGWFSGEGDYNFILKGFKISDKSDYATLEKTIRANSSTRNITCFSEILDNTEQVLEDLSVFSNVFSLHFFTDGYPVVSNYRREIDNIFKAVGKIKGKLSTAMLVGYGSYYNKELMGEIAEKLGALCIHSSMIPEYKTSITRLVKLTSASEPKMEIDPLVKSAESIFMVTDQGIVLSSVDADGKLYVSPQKGKATTVFYLTAEKAHKNWKKVQMEDVDFADAGDIFAKALYGVAYVLTQKTKTDVALEVIGGVGDKKMVDAITNAFTLEEYGTVEETLEQALQNPDDRFVEGRDPKYLPPVDAFCVFDLLNILMEDEDAVFFPYHEKFKYEKIGVSSKTKEGYPKFKANDGVECPFNNFVWHGSRLNLNIQTKIDGTVVLNDVEGKSPEQLGFTKVFPTHVFRNYTFIKDGRVHTKKFYVKTSEETYKIMKNKGLVVDNTFSSDGIYGIDVSSLPAINRAIADGKTSAEELAKKVMRKQELKAIAKSLKWLKAEELEEKDLTNPEDKAVAFLEANGIKKGLFSPPVDKVDAKDKYIAKTFEVKIKKLQTLPAVKKVVGKIADDKKRTPVESLLEVGIDKFNAVKDTLKSNAVKEAWFDSSLADVNKELRSLRSDVQQTKFAVLLGKKWFDEFESREDNEIEVDEKTFVFELGEKVVEV